MNVTGSQQSHMLTVMDLFEEKASGWDEHPVPAQISAAVGPLMRALVEPTMRILDFGAGTGLVTGHVAPHVAHVVAVDLSPSMLAKLTEKPDLAGKVTTHCRDLLKEPLGERFDGIVSAMALHHVQDIAAILRTFREHLKPGGFVALADLDVEDGSFHPPEIEGVFHQGFDRDVLRARLETAGFVDIDFRTAAEVHKEGGTYRIFLVTARRDTGA